MGGSRPKSDNVFICNWTAFPITGTEANHTKNIFKIYIFYFLFNLKKLKYFKNYSEFPKAAKITVILRSEQGSWTC